MSDYTITWSECINHPWLRMEPCRIGGASTGLETPGQYVLLAHQDQPALRVDAYPSSDECFAFKNAIIWQNYLVVGWGECVYLIHVNSRAIIKHPLGSYFGHLYRHSECLLVASADHLLRISLDGSFVWQSDVLGIDGVIVDDVNDDVISGSGEWDPPGGWRPFQIRLDSGKLVTAT